MRLPDEILECVFFLGVEATRNGRTGLLYGGTGFFVSMPSGLYDRHFVYMVTARHCIERASRLGGPVYVRLNTTRGGVADVRVDGQWNFHENEGIDVAVLGFAPPTDLIEYKCLPISMFATHEFINQCEVGIGDDLCVTGLFTQRFGTTRNQPIIRFGNIAAMPGDPLQDQDSGLPYSAYLVEVRSIGGLSGSPVFVIFHSGRTVRGQTSLGGIEFNLLGLIRGHWDYRKRDSAVDFLADDLEQVNMGIAIVTPIQDVMDVLNNAELRQQRNSANEQLTMEAEPTEDSVPAAVTRTPKTGGANR